MAIQVLFEVGQEYRIEEGKVSQTRVLFGICVVLLLVGLAASAAEPVITGVSIPNLPMKIGDTVTATITVQSDSLTTYNLNASTIGGYALSNRIKLDSTTYTAQFTINSGGADYAASADIPTNITLADGGDTGTWNTAISQDNDPIDANLPTVTAIDRADSDPTNSNSVDFTVTFSESVSGIDTGDFALVLSGTASGSIDSVSAASGDTITVAVDTVAGDGGLGLNFDFDASTSVQDAAGNSAALDFTGQEYTIDNTPPSVPTGLDPADGSYTTDTSPLLSWSASTDLSGIDNYRIQIDGPASRDTYVSDTDYNPSLGVNGTYTWRIYARDNAGNSSSYTTDRTFTIDTLNPQVNDLVVNDTLITDADTPGNGTLEIEIQCSEAMDETITPTITFSPTVASTLSWNSGSWDDATTYLAYYDVSDGNVDENTVTADVTGLKDLAGNDQQDMSPWFSIEIDTLNPTVTVNIVDMVLNDTDAESLVTFEFSEDVAGFTIDDVTPVNGAISAFTTLDANSYTVLFTATDGIDDTGSVTVGTGYTDLNGNAGSGNSDTVDIDRGNPWLMSGVFTDNALIVGETSLVTFTFNEAVNGFTNEDFTTPNGTLTAVETTDGGITWTATFTPTDNVEDDYNHIFVEMTGVTDGAGNAGIGESQTGYHEIDTREPTVVVTMDDYALIVGETSLVTFTFHEAVNGFSNDDLTIPNGTLTSVATSDGGITWTGSFTPTDNLEDATNVITVDLTGVTDDAGNAGDGTDESDNYEIDTKEPTVVISANDVAIYDGDVGVDQFVVTATYSEAMNPAVVPSLVFFPGMATTFRNPSGEWSVSDTVYTWTYDVDDDGAAVADIGLMVSGAADVAGNIQVSNTNMNYIDVDLRNPTVVVTMSDYSLIVGETAVVTFTFSEAVLNFDASDVSVDTGSIGAVTVTGNPLVYTGTFTPTDDQEVDTNDITVGIDWTDDAGNAPLAGDDSPNYAIDTKEPTVTGVSTNDALITDADTPGDGTFVVTIEFSEAMNTGIAPTVNFNPVIASTLTLDGTSGWLDSDTYKAKYDTADANVDHDNVQIDVTGTQDAAGNAQLDYSPENEFGIDTVNPTVTGVVVDDTLLSDSDAGTTFTMTVDFSEPMTDDGSADPTLTFNPAVGSTLAFASDSWPTTTRYQAVYDISDAGVDEDSVTIDVTLADDENGNPQQDYTPEDEFEIDTLNPTVSGVTLSDNLITDADVGDTFTVTIDYSEPMLTTAPSLVFSPTLDTTLSFQAGSSGLQTTQRYVASYTVLDGNVTVLDDDITITNAQDLAGNIQIAYNYDDQLDVDTENPYFHDFTVTGGAVDDDCLRVVTFTAKVTDPNGTMVPGDITVAAASVTNTAAGITAEDVYDISQTSDSATTITITGKVDVENLTGCPARVTITLDAVDSVDNDATQQSQSDDVVDTTIPVINDLEFNTDNTFAVEQTVPYLVDDCGAVTIYFSATVNDNCCIVPGNVNVTVTLPTADAILEDIVISRVQNGQGRVDVAGNAVVRCLDGPDMARVQIDVSAADCCGNAATPVQTGTDEGLVDDTVLPIPQDDPRQDMVMDESAIIDPLVEVRLDEFGVYRLVLRESTPVRIDIMGNDADNLSHNVAHPFAPCISCGPCGGQTGCCAVTYIEDIVEQPSYGTVTVEDDTGNCAGGTVIRYAPDRGYLGPDYFTYRIRDAFGNVSSEIATVYLQTVPEVWMEDVFVIACEGESVEFTVSASDLFIDPDNPTVIPFAFSVTDGPEHGVVGGDLLDIFYTPASTVTDPQFGVLVPSLDFSEAAEVTLTYSPAEGYSGIDAIRVRFEDPFGGVAYAVVNITVGQCGSAIPNSILRVAQGQAVALIVPISFESIFNAGWGEVTLISLEDGQAYSGLIAAEWSEQVNRHILSISTVDLPIGSYELTIPLGNGETVTLTIEVGESE